MQQISFCLTNWNRTNLLIKSFEQIINDDRIKEFVISDDHSSIGSYQEIVDYFKFNPKVKFFRNEKQLGVYENKFMSISHATCEWCIVADSDNVYGSDFIDKIFALEPWNEYMSYQPSFLKPIFNYSRFSGLVLSRQNVSQFIGKPMFDCLLNSMNFFVNREQYLKTWMPKENILGADSIYFNYLWFKSEKAMFVVPGLEYFHLVHDGSNYKAHEHASAPQAKEIESLLKRMS